MSQVSQASVAVTPTINTAAYASGDVLGALMTFEGLTGTGGENTLQLFELNVLDIDAQQADIDLFVFNANPTASTFTNNAAFSINNADLPKLSTVISVRTHYEKVSIATEVARLVTADSAGLLYAVAVIRSAKTYTTTTSVTFVLKSVWDC